MPTTQQSEIQNSIFPTTVRSFSDLLSGQNMVQDKKKINYIPERRRVPMRTEKKFFKKNFAQFFLGPIGMFGVALESHTRLCFVTAVV